MPLIIFCLFFFWRELFKTIFKWLYNNEIRRAGLIVTRTRSRTISVSGYLFILSIFNFSKNSSWTVTAFDFHIKFECSSFFFSFFFITKFKKIKQGAFNVYLFPSSFCCFFLFQFNWRCNIFARIILFLLPDALLFY